MDEMYVQDFTTKLHHTIKSLRVNDSKEDLPSLLMRLRSLNRTLFKHSQKLALECSQLKATFEQKSFRKLETLNRLDEYKEYLSNLKARHYLWTEFITQQFETEDQIHAELLKTLEERKNYNNSLSETYIRADALLQLLGHHKSRLNHTMDYFSNYISLYHPE